MINGQDFILYVLPLIIAVLAVIVALVSSKIDGRSANN